MSNNKIAKLEVFDAENLKIKKMLVLHIIKTLKKHNAKQIVMIGNINTQIFKENLFVFRRYKLLRTLNRVKPIHRGLFFGYKFYDNFEEATSSDSKEAWNFDFNWLD